MLDFLSELWPHALGVLGIVLATLCSAHVVLYKRNERAAVAWVGLLWLSPIVGPVLYLLLGINRIRRRATQLRPERPYRRSSDATGHSVDQSLADALPSRSRHLLKLSSLLGSVTGTPLTAGNSVAILINGDSAYPEMIRAIDAGARTIVLSTYIFNSDKAGLMFADALERAVRRGVEVRVLIDGLGSWYSIPPIVGMLRQRGIPVARFLYSFFPWRMPYLNLRNHPKILVVDGTTGFTGGMNIAEGNLVQQAPRSPIADIHFRLGGPVVGHLMETFAEDWLFTTRERLEGDSWFPPIPPTGPVFARGIGAGPDEEFDRLRWTLLGALAEARSTIKILTPYFLPDEVLLAGLRLAAMRGVQVDIVMPESNNLAFVAWAATPQLDEVLSAGCRLWLSSPSFDHSKLMLIDGAWALFGSTNWDSRSLRLNFEFNVECYDCELAERLQRLIETKLAKSRPLTLAEIKGRSLPVKLRDGVARLFSPYL